MGSGTHASPPSKLVARLARRGDEAPELPGVLVARARRGLDPAADVDAPRADPLDRLRHVALVQAAGEQQPHAGGHRVGEGPVERDAGTRLVGVDEHDVDGTVADRGQRGVAGGEPLDHEGHAAAHPADVGDRLAAAELRAGEPQRVHHLDDPLRDLVAEHADGDDAGGQAMEDLADGVGRDLARAAGRED